MFAAERKYASLTKSCLFASNQATGTPSKLLVPEASVGIKHKKGGILLHPKKCSNVTELSSVMIRGGENYFSDSAVARRMYATIL